MSTPERPPFIANWRDIEKPYAWQYDEDDEAMCIGAAFGRRFGADPRLSHRQGERYFFFFACDHN